MTFVWYDKHGHVAGAKVSPRELAQYERDHMNHIESKQRPRRIVPYVEDPVTGQIRIPPHIEANLRRYSDGKPIRTKQALVLALINAMEAGIREMLLDAMQHPDR